MIQKIALLKNKTLLFVDDDTITRTYTEEILAMLFGKVISASDGEKAYKLYKDELPDIILTDVQMPNSDGISLIKQIRENDYETPIVLLTSFIEEELLLAAKHLSFNGYLSKPITLEKLISTLCKAMDINDTH